MAYSAQKSALLPPAPSPSPYSRLPTPASSQFGRPHNSRSVSTATYGSSHPSPGRPSLPHQASSYDSFAPQPCPSPAVSKIPGFGLQRSGSTVNSSHRRQSSIVEKAKLFERFDDGLMRSPSKAKGFGYNNPRVPGGIKQDTLPTLDASSPAALRTHSRPISYVDTSSVQEQFGDIKHQVTGLRRPSQPLNVADGLGKHQTQEYESQASPASMRKPLGLLSETSPISTYMNDSVRKNDSQLMPPPPPSLLRRLSASSSSAPPPITLELPIQAPQKPLSPPPQVPTPSPRKGTHVRAQSHVVTQTSKLPPRTSSTRPTDSRPTSTVGRKVTGPPRPPSTLHAIPSARPRAVSHNNIEPRRIATPANDLALPKGSRQTTGRTIAPPRSTTTRTAEPIAPSSASMRRPPATLSRPRPSSSTSGPSTGSASKGSDTESSIRSESVASTTSNTSSARSDLTTRPKAAGRVNTIAKPIQDPISPRKSSPVRGHRKAASIISSAKPSKPNFNTYKVEYQHATPTAKPPTAAIINPPTSAATHTSQPADTIHAQTKLLQLALLHARSFNSTAALKKSAQNQLYKRFSEVRNRNASVAESYRREQRLVDLDALSLVLKQPVVSAFGTGNLKDKLSGSPEEAIQLLSEQLSKVLGWFAGGQYEGEYTRVVRIFDEWLSLPDEHEKKVDGLGIEYARDILRVKRKMDMALRGLEGWVSLVVEGELGDDGYEGSTLKNSLGRLLSVAVGHLKAGLEELNAIQRIETTVVSTTRKDLRKKLDEVMDNRKEAGPMQQKKDLAAWEPVWATAS
ncbi:hypothetical protein ABW20_dc0108058 [Dactylellina cionopaga]|nr:hypothetical protein ABW20_dc0108058 [Dactylellina cionopaga]